MKIRRFLIFVVFSLFWYASVYAQVKSVFDYGKNEDVYFISAAEIDSLGLSSFIEITGRQPGESGGMHENWDVMEYDFSYDGFVEKWSIAHLDDNWTFQLDSLLDNTRFINGFCLYLDRGDLQEYGGFGYGSFDYIEVLERNDSCSISLTNCRGHCGSFMKGHRSINYFSKDGRLIQSHIFDEEPLDYAKDENEENRSNRDSLQQVNVVDTFYYKYNDQGQLIQFNDYTFDPKNPLKEYESKLIEDRNKFYQMFVGETPMEEHIQKQLGVKPSLLILEIYRYGAFFLIYNSIEHKYYPLDIIVLEQ